MSIGSENSATLYLDPGALLTNSAVRVSGRHCFSNRNVTSNRRAGTRRRGRRCKAAMVRGSAAAIQQNLLLYRTHSPAWDLGHSA